MGVRCVQIVCVCLGVLGFIAAVITCAFPNWTVKFIMIDYRQIEVHAGLWMVCFYKSISDFRCSSSLFINWYTIVFRGLTVACCVITAFSLLPLFSACRRNRGVDPKRRWAAVGMAVSGLLLIIPVSLTASDILSYQLDHQDLGMGMCMWTGWVGGALLLLAGVTLCCCSCPSSANPQETTEHHNHHALTPRATP